MLKILVTKSKNNSKPSPNLKFNNKGNKSNKTLNNPNNSSKSPSNTHFGRTLITNNEYLNQNISTSKISRTSY